MRFPTLREVEITQEQLYEDIRFPVVIGEYRRDQCLHEESWLRASPVLPYQEKLDRAWIYRLD